MRFDQPFQAGTKNFCPHPIIHTFFRFVGKNFENNCVNFLWSIFAGCWFINLFPHIGSLRFLNFHNPNAKVFQKILPSPYNPHFFSIWKPEFLKYSEKILCAMLSREMPSTSQHILPRLFSRKRGSYMKRYFHSPHILPAGRLLSQKSHNLRLKSWPAEQCWILLRPLFGVSLVRIYAESWRTDSAARSTGPFSASLYSVVNEEFIPSYK